jgi:hypothetical protein
MIVLAAFGVLALVLVGVAVGVYLVVRGNP